MATAAHRSFAHDEDPLAKMVGQMVREMDAAAPDGDRDDDRAHHTHAFMDGSNPSKRAVGYNRGWIRLPDAQHDEFLDTMGHSLDCNFTPCVSERATRVRRAFADFDEETATSKDTEWQLTVARLWQKALRQCWPHAPPHVFTVCVLLRKEVPKEVTTNGRTVHKIKNGMHLVAPNLHVTEAQLSVVRDVALRLLHDTDMLLEKGDGTWEKILDPKFDTLRMMGNFKAVKCKVCRNRVRMRKNCVECGGEGLLIDHNAVYDLDHVLGADGELDEAIETVVARQTTAQKLKLTCIRTVAATQPLAGFVCPAFVDPRQREAAMAVDEGQAQDAGDEEEVGKDGKKKEKLEQGDPHFALIQEYVRELHPDYRHIRLREVIVVRSQRNKRIKYIARPWEANSFPCLNLVDCVPHNSEGIYFVIPRKSGQVFQRCNCKCPKGIADGRVLGQCSKVESRGQQNVVLPVDARLEMFDYPVHDRRALLEMAEVEALSQRADPWIAGGEELLMRMCMSAMGSPPILHSVEGEQERNALTAFLRRAGGRKAPNIRARQAAIERAKVTAQEIQARIVELAEKLVNPSHGAGGVMRRALQSSMRQEVGALRDMRGVQQGTHQFTETDTAGQGVGADGNVDFVKVDEETGVMTYFPDRDTLEALRMREIHSQRHRGGEEDGWDAAYAKFQATFACNGSHRGGVGSGGAEAPTAN